MKKKRISLIMAVVVLISMLNMTVFAQNGQEKIDKKSKNQNAVGRVEVGIDDISATILELGKSYTVKGKNWFKFQVTEDGYYKMYTYSGIIGDSGIDPYLVVYYVNENGDLEEWNEADDDFGLEFTYCEYFYAGEEYYFSTNDFGESDKEYTITFDKGTEWDTYRSDIYTMDYEQYKAFLASGGTINYSALLNTLEISTEGFKDKSHVWEPEYEIRWQRLGTKFYKYKVYYGSLSDDSLRGIYTTKNGAIVPCDDNQTLGEGLDIPLLLMKYGQVYADKVTVTGPQSVTAGSMIRLSASLSSELGLQPNCGVSWSSSNSAVASVDGAGNVMGRQAGSAVITCSSTDGRASAQYRVNVQQRVQPVSVTKVSLNYGKITMKKGTKFTWLKAEVSPTNATDKSITWTSSNTKVVTVNSKGVITAKNTGSAKITATAANGKKAQVTVKVQKNKVRVSKVKLNKKKATLKKGKQLKLKATLSPVNAASKKVTWKSSNKNVATVNAKGVIKAKKAGKVKITCISKENPKKKAVCTITVK